MYRLTKYTKNKLCFKLVFLYTMEVKVSAPYDRKHSLTIVIKPEINLQESHIPFSARLRILIQQHWKCCGAFSHILVSIFLFYVLCKKINFRKAVHCNRRSLYYWTKLVHLVRFCSFKWEGEFKNAVATAKFYSVQLEGNLTMLFRGKSLGYKTPKEKLTNKMQPRSRIYYSMFLNCSTCFGRHTAHYQELKNCNCSLWFYTQVEQLRNIGIINSTTRLHLVGSFYEFYVQEI
jgi:hypothetical protein